ncbi:hypothetical protein GJAV_G00088220, partial [Gymnothorax javanicus]
MMQAGVCLRQDTETTLPELPEQHRIREKEEELHGLESDHMAESEIKCTAAGLNTLEPECVTANSRVSDLHHTEASLIKTETDLGLTHTADPVRTEIQECTELGYETDLHPDQMKAETDDGGYCIAENIGDLQVVQCDIKFDQIKCETSESVERSVLDAVSAGGGVDHEDKTESWQCAGELNANSEEILDLRTEGWF